jgi:hypothetical protein
MQRHVEHKHASRKPPRKKKQPRERRDTIPVAPRSDDKEQDDKQLEGEGSYTAGRRYDDAATKFSKSGEVETRAREAASDLSDDELLDGGPSFEDDMADTRPGFRR